MVQLPQLKHVALATLLGTTALTGTVGHAVAQDTQEAVALPANSADGALPAIVASPAEPSRVIAVQDGNLTSLVVLSPGNAGPAAPSDDAVMPSDDPPLDNPAAPGAAFPNNPWTG
jgi:hypothetical protein